MGDSFPGRPNHGAADGRSRRQHGCVPSDVPPIELARPVRGLKSLFGRTWDGPSPVRPVVKDQGDVPCCVSIAVASAMESLESADDRPPVLLSPLFNYYNARRSPGLIERIELAAGVASALSAGICPDEMHAVPMDEGGALRPPSDQARLAAAQRRLAGPDPFNWSPRCHRLPDHSRLQDWTACLNGRLPVLIGFWVTAAYDAATAGPDFAHGDPTGLPVRDGHAVLVVGHDPARNLFEVQDCQGPTFADGGRWWLPYAVAANTNCVFESWVIGGLAY